MQPIHGHPNGALIVIDYAHSPEALKQVLVSLRKQTGKKLHVVFDDDKELVGVDAFIYIWKRTDGYGWLGKFIGLPVIKQCAVFAYSVLAFLLFWRFKIFNKS